MEMVTIPKKEYDRLKKTAVQETPLAKQFEESLADLKAGRVRRVAMTQEEADKRIQEVLDDYKEGRFRRVA